MDLSVDDKICREKRQHSPRDDSLNDVRGGGPSAHDGGDPPAHGIELRIWLWSGCAWVTGNPEATAEGANRLGGVYEIASRFIHQ